MACFGDLSDDILYHVLEHTSLVRSSTLRILRLVSKRMNVFADSILYRTLILQEDNVSQEQASYRCIERLLDPSDALRRHVRFLHVDSFKGDDGSTCMNMQLLIACLNAIRKLDSFSWASDVDMSDSLVVALRRCHPNAQIHVSLKHLDQAIISSKLLRRLSVSIPCSDVTYPDSLAPFEHLRRTLLCSPNLRALAVDVHFDANLSQAADKTPDTIENYTTHKIQIPLEQMDQLPSLEELAFNARAYDFDREHCIRLLQCMDWSKLKRLSLGPSNPTNFFYLFTGKTPALEHIDIAYHSCPGVHYPYPYQDRLRYCSEFISSLDSLKKITIRCDIVDLSLRFWRRLVATHGERLESFSLRSRHDLYEEPILRYPISDWLIHFTALRNLDLPILYTAPPKLASCAHCAAPCHSISTDYIEKIPVLPTLETLRLSVRIHQCSNRSLTSAVTDHAHCFARTLWAKYTDDLRENRLKVFSHHFWCWKMPSPHPDEHKLSNSIIDSIVFESIMKQWQLVIKACDHRNTITTYYEKNLESRLYTSDGEERPRTFVATYQHRRERPYI